MDNPYSKYLDDEYDEVELMKETHKLILSGDIEAAKLNAMKAEAVKYVKQSLKKVEYGIKRSGSDGHSV